MDPAGRSQAETGSERKEFVGATGSIQGEAAPRGSDKGKCTDSHAVRGLPTRVLGEGEEVSAESPVAAPTQRRETPERDLWEIASHRAGRLKPKGNIRKGRLDTEA